MTTKRIAVLSTPRSGNTWLRGLLRGLTDGVELSEHRPRDFAWDALPHATTLQLHWYPTSQFRALLSKHDFSVVTIARHPLDVLMSVLHFCRHEANTTQWLDGVGGDEQALLSCGPLSPALVDYAHSERFQLLLGVTPAWHGSAKAWLRYEDLVADTARQLLRLADELHVPTEPEVLDKVIASRAMPVMQSHMVNQHYWQGRPGLWRSLLPPEQVELLRPALADFTEPYGYDLTPDPTTTPETAQAAWDAMAVPSSPSAA
jgi:hypothetical protein